MPAGFLVLKFSLVVWIGIASVSLVQMTLQIIGIDCSTDPRGMGFARGHLVGGNCQLETAAPGTNHAANVRLVAQWLEDGIPSLICVDAPLGWPVPLGPNLAAHTAGAPVPTVPNQLFRRETDREVKRRLNKQSLDVGADRIARTAHAALGFLDQVQTASGVKLPMAWSPALPLAAAGVIEVYPAATLIAHCFTASGYKKREQVAERQGILGQLATVLGMPEDVAPMLASADALDAAVCVLAGFDFMAGACQSPVDTELARKEGWIWVRTPG
ncbi:DUF429 domain-containing protein [Parahaliea aestuarii]|uniref:DUF429 domain-containing protein n=1 Tax=Parahaliea aestuarii TaxID=1852021 RepID=UPI001650D390|nr:DUF429 domain-containing protein [Parahaliea aestuarii]